VFALAKGDLNRDGHLDLVTARGGHIFVLLGLGTGAFEIDAPYFVLDQFVPMIALHDLSGDGCLNVIVLGWTIDRVLISRECYTERRPRVMSMGGFPFPAPRACAVLDVNHDGMMDMVVVGGEWEDGDDWTILSVLLGRGGGQ